MMILLVVTMVASLEVRATCLDALASRLASATPASASPAISPQAIAEVGWPNFLNRTWDQTPIVYTLNERWADLPFAARANMLRTRELAAERPFSPLTASRFNFKNDISDASEPLSSLLTPPMRAPHARAIEMLSDTGGWINYFEDTVGEIFTRMLNSGDPALILAANHGKISQRVMMDLFRERFAARGLTISEIPPPPALSDKRGLKL